MKIAKSCVCCDGTALRRVPAVLMPFLAHRIFGWDSVEITPDWAMRDLTLGRAYSVCNTLACEGCGLLFLDMRFDDAEMAALYADYRGPAYRAQRERFEPGYGARNDILLGGSAYIPAIEAILADHVAAAPRVLDWGGDTGVNTPFKDRASLHHVYDISDKPVVSGAERVTLDQARTGPYDLVVSSNLLEHVPFPREQLREIAAAMNPGTILYLEVPHEDIVRLVPNSGDRAAAKRHWHEHVNFFTEEAIDAMMEQAGLETLTRISHPVSAGGEGSHVFSIVARSRRPLETPTRPPL
ncbi:class I SAM-dependent methyltransferase [Methylobacterium sp. WL6]|uniref:class I SAM-dependent methyltransferase n=1 Tax=Methylobacterium sp. WL6 TaxID=2603901 RepID=UPI0011C75AD1|nr:class I SAM-dependent methyltransferase [Methylobacterium sp. WL6]TXN70446.1 class I SAM-dependent methyltransferase [Methylobacterium sp. WL6]